MPTIQLPLIPLELVLLPGEQIHLHIFEPRYRQLLADCVVQNSGFGIPYTERGKWGEIGSFVKILPGFETNADGTTDIEIRAEENFVIQKIFLSKDDRMYPTGDVELIANTRNPVSEILMRTMGVYLKQSQKPFVPELLDTSLTVYDVGRLIQLNNKDKIKLIKSKSDKEREVLLFNRLKLFTKIQSQVKSIQGEFFLN